MAAGFTDRLGLVRALKRSPGEMEGTPLRGGGGTGLFTSSPSLMLPEVEEELQAVSD